MQSSCRHPVPFGCRSLLPCHRVVTLFSRFANPPQDFDAEEQEQIEEEHESGAHLDSAAPAAAAAAVLLLLLLLLLLVMVVLHLCAGLTSSSPIGCSCRAMLHCQPFVPLSIAETELLDALGSCIT